MSKTYLLACTRSCRSYSLDSLGLQDIRVSDDIAPWKSIQNQYHTFATSGCHIKIVPGYTRALKREKQYLAACLTAHRLALEHTLSICGVSPLFADGFRDGCLVCLLPMLRPSLPQARVQLKIRFCEPGQTSSHPRPMLQISMHFKLACFPCIAYSKSR